MKKLLFIFMGVLTFSTIGCSNGSTQSNTKIDSTSVDSDSIVNDTVDTLTTAQYDSIMANC